MGTFCKLTEVLKRKNLFMIPSETCGHVGRHVYWTDAVHGGYACLLD